MKKYDFECKNRISDAVRMSNRILNVKIGYSVSGRMSKKEKRNGKSNQLHLAVTRSYFEWPKTAVQ